MTTQTQNQAQSKTVSQVFGIDPATLTADPVVKVRTDVPDWAQPYIPTVKNHSFNREVYNDLQEFNLLGYKDGCLFVTGPKGAGKSSTIEQYYARLGQPVFRITGHARLELSDLIGLMSVREGQTVFQHGPLSLAAMSGGIFLFDEADACPPEVLVGLHGILEMGDHFVIAENGSQVVKIHPAFRVVVTGNTAGDGDVSGEYAGTVVQNSATLDRFNFLEWDYPDFDVEKSILLSAVPQLQKAPRIAEDLLVAARDTRADGGVEPISTRALIRWARKAVAFKGNPLQRSLDRAFAFRLDPARRNEVYAICAAVIGETGFYGKKGA